MPAKAIEFDLEGVSVFVGMPAHRPLDICTHMSLAKSWETCKANGISIEMHVQENSSVIQIARDGAAHAFLQGNHSHLFWIDSDMEWEPEDFMRLLCWGTKMECVGVSYPKKEDPIVFCCQPELDGGQKLYSNEYGCIEMDGFGLGFTVVQRKVMEELAAKAPLVLQGDKLQKNIFRIELHKSERARKAGAEFEYVGEDITFFSDVRSLGYKVWLDPTVRVGHIGKKIYKAAFGDLLSKPMPDEEKGNGSTSSS